MQDSAEPDFLCRPLRLALTAQLPSIQFEPVRLRAEPANIWKARQFIEQHCGEHISLEKVARSVSANPTYFSEKFKQVTGTNFVDYVARTRFDRAQKLLQNGNVPISEIAFAAGF